MDPALSSLFPIHQIGSDGFSWWIGQVESEKNADPKNSGRYRVRIIGQHLKDCDATPTDQLPWAQVMMPVTTPFSDGGLTGAGVGLNQGNWVVGFYLDNDRQKPIIMGSIGHTAGATQRANVEKDPAPGETCKSFTTFLDPNINPSIHTPMASGEKRNGDQPAQSTVAEDTGVTKPGEAGQISGAVPGQLPPAFYGLFADSTTTNPTGNKLCVEIANPECGSENDLKGGLTKIIGDMLKATQQSGGNLGSFYVSKVNGELNSYVDHGMEYVNKAVRLVKSFVARVKGELVKLIREGVDQLVELILYEKVAEDKIEEAAEKAKTSEIDKVSEAEEPATKKQSRLKPIMDAVNDVLDDLGCSMADLTDRLAKWLTDLLLGYLMDAYSNAACLVDNAVNGILNQITAFIDELISKVMGPLQEIMNILAVPINIIGNAINSVLNLLGISCDGPAASCQKIIKECVDCGTGDDEDWLDKLIDQLTDGPLDNTTYVCDEAKNASAIKSLEPTNVFFVGGTFPPGEEDETTGIPTDIFISYSFDDVFVTEGEQAKFTFTRGGNTTTASSIKMTVIGGTAEEGVDYSKTFSGSIIGFAPGAKKKSVTFETYKDKISEGPEYFYVKIEEQVTPEGFEVTYPNGIVKACTIENFDDKKISPPAGVDPKTPYIPPSLVATDDVVVQPLPTIDTTVTQEPSISIISDKSFYKEGDVVTYTVFTSGYNEGKVFNYTIEGDVDENDFEGGLTGSFTLDANGVADFTRVISVNDDVQTVTQTVNVFDETTGEVTGTEEVVVVDGNQPDPIESFTLYVDNTLAYTTAFIIADDDPDQTQVAWSVTSDENIVSEGETVTFTISTLNIPDGTNFKYQLVGTITESDVVGARLESTVDFDAKPLQVIDSQCVVPITMASDGEIEGSEYFDFTIVSYFTSDGTEVPVTGASTLVYVTSETTSVEDPDTDVTAPSYFVSTDKLEYSEGETIIYSIETSNVPNGTVLQYTLYGTGINTQDFDNNSLFGTFEVVDNTSTVYVGIAEDTTIESQEQVTFVINGTGASADVFILGQDTEDDPPVPDTRRPCFDKPVAGQPITDENGSIISIPITESGCPYVFPPKVIITGPGYGASGIALTDSRGKVTEVRVTRSGIGYNIKRPTDFDLRCVIDSYTIIKPGVGYTEAPDVYVDGVAGRAEAIIDDRGYVISIQPTDRTTTYNEIPKVIIVGGGGQGARVVPSIVCLDTKEYEDQGYAKIGTGRYVDCP